MRGHRQQRILDLLADRGALCVEAIAGELGPDPAGREQLRRSLARLAADGVVLISGRHGRKGLAAALVCLAAPVSGHLGGRRTATGGMAEAPA